MPLLRAGGISVAGEPHLSPSESMSVHLGVTPWGGQGRAPKSKKPGYPFRSRVILILAYS